SEVRKQTAYLSVLGGNYQNLTALENLKFALKLSKVEFSKEQLLDRLEHVGLIDAKNKMVREFSSGMKKRLSIAKLISVDAKLWLLDEPFAALDSEGKNLVDDLIIRAKKEQRTVIIASHDVERSSQFADTVLSIEDGSLKLEKSLNNG
ncbi:MAG TPA: ATP-binding cassette domain-containing protein, partial [Trueperaceae bacterium]|nr:ATP-binding cassette domain-containing protein [Trueperaceae bacterium]